VSGKKGNHFGYQFFLCTEEKNSVLCFLLSNSPVSEIQTPGNYLEENIQHKENGESLKSTKNSVLCFLLCNSLASEIQTPGNYPEENIQTYRKRRKF
jgi:hypothetical protein